jgi:hypothetical protein
MMSDWISVKERLPERNRYEGENTQDTREGVLVWVSYLSPCKEDRRDNCGWVRQAKLNWNGIWIDLDEETLLESTEGASITHWMPLPNPPQIENAPGSSREH